MGHVDYSLAAPLSSFSPAAASLLLSPRENVARYLLPSKQRPSRPPLRLIMRRLLISQDLLDYRGTACLTFQQSRVGKDA